MYHPYFRGKQYELITIRENARLLKESGFVPIIEPVKESTNGLKRAIDEIRIADGECILIINPSHGDHVHDDQTLYNLLVDEYSNYPRLAAGILLAEDISLEKVKDLCARLHERQVTLIHCGFNNGKALAQALPDCLNVTRHLFVEDFCGKLYRKHFPPGSRVLIRDGFQKRTNRAHPPLELFSDLHATFREEGRHSLSCEQCTSAGYALLSSLMSTITSMSCAPDQQRGQMFARKNRYAVLRGRLETATSMPRHRQPRTFPHRLTGTLLTNGSPLPQRQRERRRQEILDVQTGA